jgi:hypothetical protein
MTDYFETYFKKGRGMARRSLDLIEAQAREQDIIPWGWIVDETRVIERMSTWDDPEEYAECVAQSYRRDFWNQQPHRVKILSEKGTVRGLLAPVLDHYAVGFVPVHGFSSATTAHDIAEDDDGRDLIVLYVGGFDPSGLFMSEPDLPARFVKYDGDHVKLKRIALARAQTRGLPSFPASDKRKVPRYKWFVARCEDQRSSVLNAVNPPLMRTSAGLGIRRAVKPSIRAPSRMRRAAS